MNKIYHGLTRKNIKEEDKICHGITRKRKAKGHRPNNLSICPVPSSPSLKNGGPFFTDWLSGFIENRKANISCKKDFYRMLEMELSPYFRTSHRNTIKFNNKKTFFSPSVIRRSVKFRKTINKLYSSFSKGDFLIILIYFFTNFFKSNYLRI